ncbi:MAG: GPR endopeptidase [Clostridia bacterium]|nr:GPR endopeptidase [Clostridia bacterium]
MNFDRIRDLACECERIGKLPFDIKTEDFLHYSLSRLELNENEAKLVGRPSGRYVSIFSGSVSELDGESASDISEALSRELALMAKAVTGKDASCLKAVLAGLGNRSVGYDSFGARVCEMTAPSSRLAVFKIGVPSQSGLTSSRFLRCVADCAKADLAVVLDSLVAKSEERVGRIIQLADSGVTAGSGVGNHSDRIDGDALGIPVIAIGLPTALETEGSLMKMGYLAVSAQAENIAKSGARIVSRGIEMLFAD